MHFNLLVLAAFSQYEFKRSAEKQLAVAYTSTIVTSSSSSSSHFFADKEERPLTDLAEYLLTPAQPVWPQLQETYSVVEPPKRDQDSPERSKQEINEHSWKGRYIDSIDYNDCTSIKQVVVIIYNGVYILCSINVYGNILLIHYLI